MKTQLETIRQMTITEPRQQPASAARRCHILLVDDDHYVRDLHVGVLIRSGYEVDAAGDGVEAWRVLNEDRYDLLITDHQMPWVTGLELIQKLRAESMILPVILTSGVVPTEALKRLPGLKIEAVVQKPCPLDKFLQTVSDVLVAAGITSTWSAPGSQSTAS